mgnify:CR=1 FL=1
MCIQCGSFNHLRQDCVHTMEKGSNRIGPDGKKLQCSHCLSYDHLTQQCKKIHSEKLGKNPIGIGGKKISCEVCNSFHHLTADHESAAALIIKESRVTSNGSKTISTNGEGEVFRWCLLPKEVGNTPCSICGASHHAFDTCPHRNSREYGRNPVLNGEMLSCSVCGSFAHVEDTCFHSEKNGRNPISNGKKLQCIYCKSYNHVVGCTEQHNERADDQAKTSSPSIGRRSNGARRKNHLLCPPRFGRPPKAI